MLRVRVALILLGILLIGLASSDEASAYRRGGRGRGRGGYGYSWGAARQVAISSIRGQVAYFDSIADQAEATAAAASVHVDAANARISAAREAIASSDKDARQANKDMKAAEDEMLEAAGADSDIVQAKDKYDKARADIQHQEQRVLNSPAYRAELAKTEGTDEHERVVPMLRINALDNDEQYQHAKMMVAQARNEYMDLRNHAVTHDAHWLAASEEKRRSLAAEAAALNEGTKGGLQKLPAAETMHRAQHVAAQARAYADSGRAMLMAMGGSSRQSKKPATAFPSAGK